MDFLEATRLSKTKKRDRAITIYGEQFRRSFDETYIVIDGNFDDKYYDDLKQLIEDEYKDKIISPFMVVSSPGLCSYILVLVNDKILLSNKITRFCKQKKINIYLR